MIQLQEKQEQIDLERSARFDSGRIFDTQGKWTWKLVGETDKIQRALLQFMFLAIMHIWELFLIPTGETIALVQS